MRSINAIIFGVFVSVYVIVQPAVALSPIIDPEDPCAVDISTLTKGSLNLTDQTPTWSDAQALYTISYHLRRTLWEMKMMTEEVENYENPESVDLHGDPLDDARLNYEIWSFKLMLKRLGECRPSISGVLDRIDERLDELGANVLSIGPSPRDPQRHRDTEEEELLLLIEIVEDMSAEYPPFPQPDQKK